MGPSESRAIVREKKTVRAMVGVYCADHHPSATGLCTDCRSLLAYALERLDRCPYCEDKPTCKDCPVHCYRSEPREAIRVVMRYAGPRMLWRHPWLGIVHLWKERARRNPGRLPRRGMPQ